MGFASTISTAALWGALLAYVAVSAREIVRGHPENVRALFAHDTNIFCLACWTSTDRHGLARTRRQPAALAFEVRGQAVRTVFRAQSPRRHRGGNCGEAVGNTGVRRAVPCRRLCRVVARVEIKQ